MEWETADVFEFLQYYKDERSLWDTRCASNKSRSEQHAAWVRIQSKLKNRIKGDPDLSVKELKKKKESLLSNYRKIRSKLLKGDDEMFKPEWCFYNFIAEFIDDVYNPRHINNNSQDDCDSATEESSMEPSSEYLSEISIVEVPKAKRKRVNIPSYVEESSEEESDMVQEQTTQDAIRIIPEDKFALWTRVWESKLRELPAEQVVHAEKLINDVLYVAALGSLSRKCSLSVPELSENTQSTPIRHF